MQTQVTKTIQENSLLQAGDKVVVGVSGGPDSVALLLWLHQNKYDLVVAHMNYQSRGKDSNQDEKFTSQLVSKLGYSFAIKNIKLDSKQAGFEAKARDVRYKFFEEVRKEKGADKIAVAHNSDDLVETMLLHLLRGAGPRGLAGMAYQRDRVIRPFLDVSREEIIGFLKKNQSVYRTDKSNKDIHFRRNWVRWRLLPYLRRQVNLNITNQLRQSARQFGDLADLVEEEAADQIRKLKMTQTEYKLKPFLQLPKVIQGEIVRTLLGKHNITKDHVTEVLEVLAKSESKKQKTFKGITIEKRQDRFLVF